MKKCLFLVSNQQDQLNKNKSYSALDSYISMNNPGYDIEQFPPLRTNVNEWKSYVETVDKKYEKYLIILMNRLNIIHGVEYNQNYWKQMFYLGLKGYITRVYEFYMQASTRFSHNRHTIRILNQNSFYTPFDLQDANNYLSNSELAQEQLFSIYIQTFYQQLQEETFFAENNFGHIKRKSKVSFKYKTALSLLKLLRFNKPSILLAGINYDKNYILKLLLKSHFRIFWLEFKPFQHSMACEKSNMDRSLLARHDETFDDFDKFFFNTLPDFFPTVFLEEYQSAHTYYEKACDRYQHLKYVVSESWIADNQLSFFIAQLRLRNIELICSEHKGLQQPFIGTSIYDLTELSDKYFTSGWYSEHYNEHSNLIKTGLLHKVKGSKYFPEFKNKILYLTAPAFAKKYTYNCNASFMGEDGLEHFSFQKSFFASINKGILKSIVYRIAPRYRSKSIIMYDQENIFKKYLKHSVMDRSECSGIDAMHNAKLVIIDYLNSGYVESLVNNYPTLLFLNTNDYLEEDQLHIFDKLIEAQVVHTSGESAGEFLVKIYNDPMIWWMSDKVQEARKAFLKAQIGKPEALMKKILALLK